MYRDVPRCMVVSSRPQAVINESLLQEEVLEMGIVRYTKTLDYRSYKEKDRLAFMATKVRGTFGTTWNIGRCHCWWYLRGAA